MKLTEDEQHLIDIIKTKLPKSQLTKDQKTKLSKTFNEEGRTYKIIAKIRYDDECGNWHNTFTITGGVYDVTNTNGACYDRNFVTGGCIHGEIEKHFPKLRKYIKWHLTSSDGPMYYYANSMYFSSDRDHNGRRKGEPEGYRYLLFVKTAEGHWIEPKMHLNKDYSGLFGWMNSIGATESPGYADLQFSSTNIATEVRENESDHSCVKYKNMATLVAEVDGKMHVYRGNKHKVYWPWHDFNKSTKPLEDMIEEDLDILNGERWQILKEPYGYAEGKEPELEKARAAAVWPDAELEDFTVEKLAARLPALMEEFKADMEELGFVY